MRTLESTVGQTRRNIRRLLVAGLLLALGPAIFGGFLYVLGRPRPDVTLTFSELGAYLAVLGVLHLLLYAGLFWQFGRLSRRPRLPSDPRPAALPGVPAERA